MSTELYPDNSAFSFAADVGKNAAAEVMERLFGVKPEINESFAFLQNARRGSRLVQYWVRRDGWVTIGPTRYTNGPEYLFYLEDKRFKPLPPEFGVELAGGQGTTMETGQGFKQFQKFFDAGGLTLIDTKGEYNHAPGEYVMPLEQAASLGLHRLKWAKEVRPDLKSIVDYTCQYGCRDGRNNVRLFIGEEARDNHVLAVHKEAVATEAIGRNLQNAIEGMSEMRQVDPALIAQVVAGVMAAMTSTEAGAIAGVKLKGERDRLEAEAAARVDPNIDFPRDPSEELFKNLSTFANTAAGKQLERKRGRPKKYILPEYPSDLTSNDGSAIEDADFDSTE